MTFKSLGQILPLTDREEDFLRGVLRGLNTLVAWREAGLEGGVEDAEALLASHRALEFVEREAILDQEVLADELPDREALEKRVLRRALIASSEELKAYELYAKLQGWLKAPDAPTTVDPMLGFWVEMVESGRKTLEELAAVLSADKLERVRLSLPHPSGPSPDDLPGSGG